MKFFKKKTNWYKIFESDLESLPLNRPLLADAGGRAVCVVRSESGIFAVDDICPHQGASLSGGYCAEGNIICPWHHYQFNLKNGRQIGGGGDYIDTYKIESREDGIYVGIEKTVFSLF